MNASHQVKAVTIALLFLSAPATAQNHSVLIQSSRANDKLQFQMSPCPTGPIEVHVIVHLLDGERIRLPKHKTTCDPRTGSGIGPWLPPEYDGFYFDVEIVDPATGRPICGTGGIVI
ncbi:MAG: hypothetical protein JNM84_06945 [Planctomycetes bacterium]|nr:hypothetical protein [Planctomycetota bacterium]